MLNFTELLTASEEDLVRLFYKINTDSADDFIIRINKVAAQLGLNHSQLVCALGFNKHIRELSDIYSTLGFRSYKLLSYRTNELFRTDTYNQLPIDNILDIYSERLEDQQILESLKEMLHPRLEHIETDIEKNGDPAHIISYRMEVHSIYNAGIVDQSFAETRIGKDIGKFRLMANEVLTIVGAGLLPPSNLFFLDTLIPEEKKELIDHDHITPAMIANRLQNRHISEAERDMLEGHL
ncbi:MAG: hypothetical protein EPO31_09310 [Gammaproteobacteria bacterium]|nr:MAG: hypothetical protein EPO31_09310 [Gammaproteobacteria bacterium]